MQLILETEATADISVKMTTVEDSLDTQLKDSIGNLCNGNKENIECQKNIITNTADDIDGDHKDQNDIEPESPCTAQDMKLKLEINSDDHSELPSTAKDVKIELEIKKDNGDNNGASNGNYYENSNNSSIHNTDDMNGNGQTCEDNPVVEEKVAKAENVLVSKIVTHESEEASLSSKNCTNVDTKCGEPEESEDTGKNTKIEKNSNNTDADAKVLKILDTEIKLVNFETNDKTDSSKDSVEVLEKEASSLADQVDEDISEMALAVDQIISEMSMPINDDIIEDVNPVSGNTSQEKILVNDAESDNDVSKAEHAPKANLVHIESERDVEDLPENIVDLDQDKNCVKKSEIEVPIATEKNDTDSKSVGKTDDNKSEVVVLVAPEQSKGETIVLVSSEEKKIETMDDDDVIQIESENDNEVFENVNNDVGLPKKVVEDDAQNIADNDQTMTEVDTSKTISSGSSENKSDKNNIDVVPGELAKSTDDKVEVFDLDEIKELPKVTVSATSQSVKADEIIKSPIIKLSNTLDILSDDDEDQPQPEPQKTAETICTEKHCINIEDDDDIMLIDEDTDISKNQKTEPVQLMDTDAKKEEESTKCTIDLENVETIETKEVNSTVGVTEKDPVAATPEVKCLSKEFEITETVKEEEHVFKEPLKPLLPDNFLKSCKKNLADMTRDELEEFCIIKIVESIVDRSNLGEIKSKLKTMAQNIDEHKKKTLMLTKQNRDLQLVLKSVQEEQKKKPDAAITPLKITRSVGMQVLMTEKIGSRKKSITNNIIPLAPPNAIRNIRTPNQSPQAQKQASNQQIPVPRLVPAAANPVAKSPITQTSPINNQVKTANQFNGARMSPPVQKAEKRPHNRLQSVTVDLTDDEPPAKVTPRSSPVPPVRLVSPQNLMSSPRPQPTASINSPRKVYIPISGNQRQNIRPGQTIILKSGVPTPGPRPRSAVSNIPRGPAPNVIKRVPNSRHPAPLPDAMKQYQPPNWKALPPAPDLKLSKVENGIVISWKIEGYQEDSYEEIASYQLYAYQETSSPPSTALWKKIGDVKALPLPMACTLTQFMAGFKYYFAVRAVDVRSRLGPFSLPGSILLLNKM